MATQSGNCFEMSVLLTTLLRGVGFDAYVVSGYATRRLALRDETVVDAVIDNLLDEYKFRDITGACEDTSFDGLHTGKRFVPSLRARGGYSIKDIGRSSQSIATAAAVAAATAAASVVANAAASVATAAATSNVAAASNPSSLSAAQGSTGIVGGGGAVGGSNAGAAANAGLVASAATPIAAGSSESGANGTTPGAANTNSNRPMSASAASGGAGGAIMNASANSGSRLGSTKYKAKGKPELKSRYLEKMSAREQEELRRNEQNNREKQLKEVCTCIS